MFVSLLPLINSAVTSPLFIRVTERAKKVCNCFVTHFSFLLRSLLIFTVHFPSTQWDSCYEVCNYSFFPFCHIDILPIPYNMLRSSVVIKLSTSLLLRNLTNLICEYSSLAKSSEYFFLFFWKFLIVHKIIESLVKRCFHIVSLLPCHSSSFLIPLNKLLLIIL